MTRHLTVAEVTDLAEVAFGGRVPEMREPGLLASAVHLAANGVDLADCDQDMAYDLVIDVASSRESDIGVIAGRLRAL
ncbi:hypothetical protein ACFWP7_03995 [Streptomyces sp. NPDC058470]|uniref:hypothetical protein n=1 Tax=Streptomyces sp. NPDC058470 TaxID=3346515 RepID=UPI003654C986